MPVYEYECDSCGVFTALRKMSESSQPAVCEDCGCQSHRIMSAPRLAVLANHNVWHMSEMKNQHMTQK
jgi:putative FmdB family regulatory protein